MQSRIIAGFAVGLCVVACSDADSSDKGSGGGGTTGTTETAYLVGGSSSSTSAGGASAQGGAGVGGSTSGAGASGLDSCPTWPAAKLLPLVGPMFYGPDPGPCVAKTYGASLTAPLEWTTFVYDSQGEVTSGSDSVNSVLTKYTWANGALVSSSSVSSSAGTESKDYAETYEYGAGFVTATPTATSSGNPTRYTLAANGYPLTRVTTNAMTGSVQDTLTYEYDGCRLKHRRATNASGASIPSGDITYEYDDAGHVVQRVAADGTTEKYDYSCWSR
jgi:YD repeat-containing protein